MVHSHLGARSYVHVPCIGSLPALEFVDFNCFFPPPQSLAKSKNSVGPWRLTGKPNPSTACPGLTMASPPCICFRISLHNVCTALKAVEGRTE